MAIFDQLWPLIEAGLVSTVEEKIQGFKYKVLSGKAILILCVKLLVMVLLDHSGHRAAWPDRRPTGEARWLLWSPCRMACPSTDPCGTLARVATVPHGLSVFIPFLISFA